MVRGEAGRLPISFNLSAPFSLNHNPVKIVLRGKRRKKEKQSSSFSQADGCSPQLGLDQTRHVRLHRAQQKILFTQSHTHFQTFDATDVDVDDDELVSTSLKAKLQLPRC